jgi:hypothetical protein
VVENHVDCIDINNNTVVVENGYPEVSSTSDSSSRIVFVAAVICRRFCGVFG